MAFPAEELKPRATAEAAPRVGTDASLTALAVTGFRAVTDLVGRFIEIVALESRAAGTALATAVGLGIGIAVLALTVWGLLVAAAVSALAAHMNVTGALLIVAGATLVVAAGVGMFLPRVLRRLSFPSTRRLLRRSGE